MKILIGNNLSVLMKKVLLPYFPESRHVADFQLSEASESEIWQLAKEQDYIIMTKDKDFITASAFLALLQKLSGLPGVIARIKKCFN